MVLGEEKVMSTGLPLFAVSSTPVNLTTTAVAPSTGASPTASFICVVGLPELPLEHATRLRVVAANAARYPKLRVCLDILLSSLECLYKTIHSWLNES